MSPRDTRPCVLIADDDELNRLFLGETLEDAGFSTVAVTDGAAALESALGETFSLALLDVDMPRMDGYEVCRQLRATEMFRHLPIVMITAHDDAVSIAHAYDAGATDFIAKPVNWTLLPHRIRYILRNADAARRLRDLAYCDSVTGLPNRQAFLDLVADAIARAGATRGAHGVTLLEINVDACARVSATFGPDAGDEAVRAFARTLIVCAHAADGGSDLISVARLDAERFAVCVRDAGSCERAARLMDQLAIALADPIASGEHRFLLPATIGIAAWPEHGSDAKTLLMHAATAKHYARDTKARGGVTYTDAIGARARQRLTLEVALRRAVGEDRLTLHFQPKFRIADGSFAGVEALLRWFDADLGGAVSPAQFVPVAEESGLILELGRWVVHTASRQLRIWQEQGLDTTIAVNFSGTQFVHDDPAALIAAAAASSGIPPSALRAEITESALISDLARVTSGLRALRDLGCSVAIDDFGTGYSSLAYLKDLRFDELKIDKSFVQRVESERVVAAICVAILSMARDLGLKVTAEGVETAGQLEWLGSHRCDEAQGFLLARPMPGHEILSRYGEQYQDSRIRSRFRGTRVKLR